MKKHIWKKSFSISFVFHFIVVITIGAMVAGFHQEIQRPKEELITVNLADTPEQIAKAQEKSSFNSFSRDIENIFKHNSDNGTIYDVLFTCSNSYLSSVVPVPMYYLQ